MPHLNRLDVVLLNTALALAGGRARASTELECTAWGEPSLVATLEVTGLDEISGAAASEAAPGLVWLHNDSGGGFELWALNEEGSLRARRTLTGARHEDWEDMALGPCSLPDEEGCRCLWVADMGGEREEITIWRVAEPDPERDGEPTAHVETVPLAYPDGPHDAETLLCTPAPERR
jgi:hypothetical protein